MSRARPRAPTRPTAYGRAKWQVEQEILRHGGFVVRPGLVYGGVPGGVFAGLVDTVRRFPLLPAILPAPRVQPIHVDDLAEGLVRVAEAGRPRVAAPATLRPKFRSPSRHSCAASPRTGSVAGGCSSRFPPLALAAVLRVSGGDGAGQRERLRSLTDLPLLATGPDLAALGLRLRSLASRDASVGVRSTPAIAARGQRVAGVCARVPRAAGADRALRAGGRTAARRAAAHLAAMGAALALLRWRCSTTGRCSMARAPASSCGDSSAATTLAEASPAGARSFLNIGERTTFATASCRIVGVLCAEAFWRLVRGLTRRAASPCRGGDP